MSNIDIAKQRLEAALVQYRNGLITESEKNQEVFDILYWILYPEQFPQA